MSGFNFGGFDLTSGFNSLSDIGDKLQKLKEDVESTIDASFANAEQESSAVEEGENAGSAEGGDDGDWLGFDVLRSFVGVVEDGTTAQQDSENKEHEHDTEVEPEGKFIQKLERQWEDITLASTTTEKKESPMASFSQTAPPDSDSAHNSVVLEEQTFNVHQEEPSPLEKMPRAEARAATDPEPVLEQPISEAAAVISVVSEQETTTPAPVVECTVLDEETPRSIKDEAAATVAAGLEAAAAASGSASFPRREENPSRTPSSTPSSSSLQILQTKGVRKEGDLADPSKMDSKGLLALVLSLQESLTARESQLERQAQEAADAAAATIALTKKNEELVLAKAAVSEKDVEEMRKEFESRLTAAEKKVVALTKERDALRRPKKEVSNAEELLKQKDEEIRQIMDEGEALSKKQLAQETTMKQLRAKIKSLKEESESLIGRLETEQNRTAVLEKDKENMAAELAAAQERQIEQLAAERQQFERQLAEARTAAAVAERKAEDAVKAGAARIYRDAEIKVEALEGTVEQLREELERRRAVADQREDLLSSEVAELQRRCAESEARQQELQSRLPEATAPLLRQLEAMQVAAEHAATSAEETERALQNKIAAAEMAVLVAKQEAEESKIVVSDAESRVAAAEERVLAATEEIIAAKAATAEEHKERLKVESLVSQLRADVDAAQDSLSTLERVYAQQMDALQAKEEEAAKAAAALREELLSRQQQQHQREQQQGPHSPGVPKTSQQKSALPTPPAMAAPGFKWVMIKEEDENNDAHAGGAGGSSNKQGIPGETRSTSSDDNNAAYSSSVLPGGSGLVSALVAATAAARGSHGNEHAAALASLQRTVHDLEATRDRLSKELVRAEGEAAAGRVSAARSAALELDIARVQQRYTSAMELLGEREEKIEELAADIVEMRDGYRQQVACLADEIERLRQRVLELETVN